MEYARTQRGGWWAVLLAVAGLILIGGAFIPGMPILLLFWVAAVFVVVALALGTLTVRDEGDALAIRYGPLPILRKRIPYADITSVEPGRTRLIDGWGIHWVPGRGTTYNLWGFGCVKLVVRGKTVRVGSDDVDPLVEFLRGKLAGD